MEFEISGGTIEVAVRMGVDKMMSNENSLGLECRWCDEGEVGEV